MSDGAAIKRILVTGASGFIGGKLSKSLLDAGFELRCQYRRSVPPQNLRDLHARGAELVRMDLSTVDYNLEKKDGNAGFRLRKLLDGVDLVYHCAALTSDWGSWISFEMANVQATAVMLDAAQDAGVKHFVYVSSLSVHGFGSHRNSTEEGPYYPPTHYYQETKLRAEQTSIACHTKKFKVAVIRPGNVYGPDDSTMMFPMFHAIERGFMGTVNGGKALTPPVYIDDMVDALMTACYKQEVYGEIINVTGGEKITWREFLDAAAEFLGAKPPSFNLTSSVALPIAYGMNTLWKLARAKTPPPLTPYRIRHVMYDFHFNIAKAEKLLDYHPLFDYRHGLQLAAESYKFMWEE